MESLLHVPTALSARLDTCDDPIDVVGLLALVAFLAGDQPVARSVGLHRVRPEARLVPPGIDVSRQASTKHRSVVLATGPGWTLVADRWLGDASATVLVTASSEDLADDVLAAAVDGAEDQAELSDDNVDLGFWHKGSHGARRVDRPVAADPWASIAANYAAPARHRIDQLVAVTATSLTGRLVLLHGPPGTGKTTLLRTVAREWRSWCRVQTVMDPEALLGCPAYLLEVLADTAHDDQWRLLVLEDCDELIRAEAKNGTGQALARLLNLTDGLLGQGTRVLVCITTNEELGRLHPTVVRPGRCLAEIEVGPLSSAEARAWLGAPHPGVGPAGATLAELFALRDGLRVDAPSGSEGFGTYL